MKKINKLTILLLAAVLYCGTMDAKSPTRVTILGDSYSTFKGEVNPIDNATWYHNNPTPDMSDINSVEQTWWWQLIESGDYVLAMNNSYSGSTICNTGYKGEDYSDRSFITRLNNLNAPDMILIFGATNDSWANAPIGEYKYANWGSAELFFFRPAMAYMLDYIQRNYPTAKPYFIINDGLKSEIVESIKTICNHYSTPYIELYNIDKIHNHPSIEGMKQISEQLVKALK